MKVCAYETTINGVPVYIRLLPCGWVVSESLSGRVLAERSWRGVPDYLPVPAENPPRFFADPAAAEAELRRYEAAFPCDQALIDEILANTRGGQYGLVEPDRLKDFLLLHPDVAHFTRALIKKVGDWGKVRMSLFDDEGDLRLSLGVPESCAHYESEIQDYGDPVHFNWHSED